jgi:acyl-CoA hydrolase
VAGVSGVSEEAAAAAEALGLSGLARVGLVTGQATAEPGESVHAVLSHLQAAQRETGSPSAVRIYRGMSINPPGVIPSGPTVRVLSSGMLGTNRAVWDRGQLDIVPVGVTGIPKLLREGRIRNDAFLVRVVPTGDGAFTTGIMNDYIPAALETAGKVLAEVCEDMPTLDGAVRIERDRIDALVANGGPLPEIGLVEASAADLEIARRVAQIVEDGDCIQIGVGGLGRAVARALAEHRRDLGIHTGLLNDDVLALIDSGAVTNRRKPLDTGFSVTPVVMGTRDFYKRLNGRKDIVLRSVEYTNDPGVVAQLDGVAAINSCVQVDLLGQLNAEVAAGRRISSVGGQLEFASGAARARGGKVIAVAKSTARDGTVSTIVPSLPDGTVTVGASLVHYVVTEYGVADLRGATIEERAHRIAAVAHPDFRRGLLEALESDRRITPAPPAAHPDAGGGAA